MLAPGRVQRVSEKVPKVPKKVWEALVQSQVRFNRVPEKVPEKVWEALVQSQVRFNRVPEKVPGSLGAKPSQVQQGSGEGRGGFGAEAGSDSTGFRRRMSELGCADGCGWRGCKGVAGNGWGEEAAGDERAWLRGRLRRAWLEGSGWKWAGRTGMENGCLSAGYVRI